MTSPDSSSHVKKPASTVVEDGWKADQPRSLKVADKPLPVVTGPSAGGVAATTSLGCVIVCSLTVVDPPRCRVPSSRGNCPNYHIIGQRPGPGSGELTVFRGGQANSSGRPGSARPADGRRALLLTVTVRLELARCPGAARRPGSPPGLTPYLGTVASFTLWLV